MPPITCQERRPPCPPPASPGHRVVGDVGGTNARFGLQAHAGAPITEVRSVACASHPSLQSALAAYIAASGAGTPAACAIGIATAITGDQVKMTNHHWAFSQADLRQQIGLQRLVVVNDFTALALAVPALDAAMLRQVGGGTALAGSAIGVIGPGTGLGVSGLLPRGGADSYVPIQGEGGHVTVAAETATEFAVLELLRARHGHASAERVVSGPGLVALALALAELRGIPLPAALTAAEVAQRSAAPADVGDTVCAEALQLFCGFLGSVAGNLALTLGTHGGVYIGGGIVPKLGLRFDASPFRARFEAKGRFSSYLAGIPVFVIDDASSPALLGAARALEAMD